MTPRDLLGWALYSPRRAVGIALVVLLALSVVGCVFALRSGTGQPAATSSTHRPTRLPSSQVSAVSTIPPATESRDTWPIARRVTQRFLGSYLVASDRPPRLVPPALARLTTPTLWRGLRLTDPAQLPHGQVQSLRRVATGAYAGEAVATLSTGQKLTVSVVAWSHGWRVADVRPAEGS